MKKFLATLKPYRTRLIITCLLAALSTVLTIFGPKVLGQITTSAVESLMSLGHLNWEPIVNNALLLIALYVGAGILSYFEAFVLAGAVSRYSYERRAKILDKINHLPLSYFDKVKYGDVLSRMTNDVDIVTNTLSSTLTEVISHTVTIVGILIMMFSISAPLSIIALIAIPLSIAAMTKLAKKAQEYFRKQRTLLGQLNSTIEEDYTGQSIIRTNSHQQKSLENFKSDNEKLYAVSWKSQFFGGLAFPIVHVFTNLSYAGICIAGGHLAISGKILIGDLQAFIQYVNQFNHPIGTLAEVVATIQQALAASERVEKFLAEPELSLDPERPKTIENIKGAVEFHDITFAYPDKDHSTINHFSAKIKAGDNVAIVGPTGAGKTTIVNLLMRFYDPDSGYITVDDVPTREMSRGYLRENFGMVLQDTWLFSGTIMENLKYGNPKATNEDVIKAAKFVGVHHFIESLPKGYQTKIDEDSDNISAGEKQLLTITRAFIANPPMMILDEATSNVDTRTEKLIQQAFAKLTKNRTSFVIAHRLSTIQNSDLILVMKDGQLIEQGNHDELLKKDGFYASLYNSQFAE